MKLFQILSSSKVYFILPWQTFFQKYFDPIVFGNWALSTLMHCKRQRAKKNANEKAGRVENKESQSFLTC